MNATPERVETPAAPGEVRGAGPAEAVDLQRGVGRGLEAGRTLAVEDPERVVPEALAVLVAQPVGAFGEERLELGPVGGAARVVAEGVQMQLRPVADPASA